MRAIWKGAISFGLVNVPVKVYSATSSHDLPLHQVHDEDGGRIRYKRTCEECGRVVAYEDIDRAYDADGRRVILTEDDLDMLPAERDHEIEIVEFVPDEQIDILRLDKSYYLEPDPKSTKPYALLRRALEETDRTAIAQFALRRKTRLAAVRVRDDVLVLQTLLWDDEVRRPAFDSLSSTPRVSAKEREMAAQLIDALSNDFDPSAFTDEYQEQLRALVDAKLEKGDAVDASDLKQSDAEGEGADVIDLMEALKRSIDSKNSTGTKAANNAGKKKAKKSATKKSTAKKAAKKNPAKTTAAKKSSKKTAAKKAGKKPAAKGA